MHGMSRKNAASLARFYLRNGCVRIPDPKLRKAGPQSYKKGFEMRFVARSDAELKRIKRLLRLSGVKPGKPYSKGRQTVQPVYGKQAVKELCEALGVESRIR